MTVTSCFDGNKFLRFFNFGNKPAKEMATEAPAEAAVEAASPVVDAPGPNALYSNSYDGYTNVRESASSKAAVLGELRNGNDYVTMIGEEGNWYEVEYYDQIGYVHKDYVSHTPSKPVTVDVDAKWLEGVWYTYGGMQAYLIFGNGKYTLLGEWYETIVAGKWHLEEDNIILTPKYFDKSSRWWSDSFNEEVMLKINKSAGTIGDSKKSIFSNPNDEEYQNQGVMEWSRADFNAEKKRVNSQVK